uniref:Transcription factor protein n=1 Tax=Ciona intestinalis TaxID=7719 RepID=Q4H325_CIOIN|nr:transcription factor protein [Ciona intestinalis]BAE06602.1 transcription factor protein [Ciona intestinalis]|eukprot:NP_001071784.1 transcription factor protein [Ciona intestinalis]
MGASGSMVGNRDRNIEMNIADEAKSGNTRAMKRHSSQPSGGAIFSSLKPRTRLHEGSIHQSASLKSSGSFDPSSASIIIPSEAVERVRKEYETLKCTKEQEIQALHTKAQKFETENHKLRAEVQALNKQYQKLRLERDAAVENSQETTERAIALEQDREKIQRQFKIFRETKESEIQALLQAKRQLESKFHTMEAHGVATIDDHNYATTSINANAGSGNNDTPGKTWWAPPPDGDAHSLFGHNPNLQTSYSTSLQEEEHQVNIPGFPHRDAWSVGTLPSSNILPISYNTQSYGRSLLKCYISCTPDEISLVKNLLSHPTILDLQSHCLKEGYCLPSYE